MLKHFFEPGNKVFTEREIYLPSGETYIPDRVVFFDEKEIGILDYKTGFVSSQHQLQIENYKNLLQEMGYRVTKYYLVYINEQKITVQ